MEAHDIRQYFTASEALWQNGLVERSGGIWNAAAKKAVKMLEHEVSWRCEDSPPWRSEMRIKRCACTAGWSPEQPGYCSHDLVFLQAG